MILINTIKSLKTKVQTPFAHSGAIRNLLPWGIGRSFHVIHSTEIIMKTRITLLLMAVAIICLAQTNRYSVSGLSAPSNPPYDGKIPPPLNLGAAYDKAIQGLGAETNQFHCISATCIPRVFPYGFGWTFVFLDTNGIQKNVCVNFDKSSTTSVRYPNDEGR